MDGWIEKGTDRYYLWQTDTKLVWAKKVQRRKRRGNFFKQPVASRAKHTYQCRFSPLAEQALAATA